MKVDLYEKIWMWGVGVILTAFFVSLAYAAVAGSMHPPSHVELIDPTPQTLMTNPRMNPQGVSVDESGAIHVRVIGVTFAWLPGEVTVPANRPITFHLTSADVVHGYMIVRTNGNAMVIPGYVSQFTTTFVEPGEYLVACNEYCGVGHQNMATKLIVVPEAEWEASPS
jgi:cytochrome c oxidase subunit 2